MAFNLFPQTDFRQMDLNYVLEVSKQAAANLEEYAADKEQVVATQAAAEQALAAAQEDIQTATQAATSASQDAQTASTAAGTATQAAESAEQDARTASAAAERAEQVQESIPADYTALSNDVDALKSDLTHIGEVTKPVNLFNGTAWNVDGYITAEGSFVSAANYKTTAPISLTAGNYLYCIKYSTYGAAALAVAICDEQGTITSVITGTDTGEIYHSDLNIIKFTLPNAAYVRTNIGASAAFIDTYMLVSGDSADDFPDEYIPYQEDSFKLSDDIELSETMKMELYRIQGKKISLNGDSICYGAGYNGGYGKIIGELFDMTVQNVAQSGGTIAAETYNGTTPRHWICRTVSQMDTDADYAILEGGANDASLSVTKGELTAGFGATLDDTTFIGALESTFKTLTTRFSGKKIGFIIVHKCTWGMSNEGSDNNNYYWAIRKTCEKWGVPYLDLNVACPPFGVVTESMTELYSLRQAYTSNADGWHLNEAGYKKYYVPKIISWLNTL